uniref:Uncharacterized protein n=1 Tax=Lotharella globosa TaxID=91324 RepID=A0A7S4E121_9EUKA|mmetsp:Transcript_12585/g.25633  ORF Transcript_12585/g.25633 Transcript_12585/m.25633 type:complete len:640 (+) Transcript_12585:87-2006(+)
MSHNDDGSRSSRSAGSTRNKTRIERILAQHQDAKPKKQRSDSKKVSSRQALINKILGDVVIKDGKPRIFDSVLSGSMKSLKYGARTNGRLSKYRPSRPHSEENRRPKSEENRKLKRQTSKSSSSSHRGKGTKSKASISSRSTTQTDLFQQLQDELEGGSKKYEISCKPGKPKSKGKRKHSGKPKKSETRAIASSKKKNLVPQHAPLDSLYFTRPNFSDIDKQQEERRAELESYLENLEGKTGADGKTIGEHLKSLDGEESKHESKADDDDEPENQVQVVMFNNPAKPMKVKEFLKKVEREFSIGFPEYTGEIQLSDGSKLGRLTQIEDFGATIDNLLQRLGDVKTLDGTGMGFQFSDRERESIDRVDVKIEKLRAMRPDAKTAEMSDKARRFLHSLRTYKAKEKKKQKKDGILGTDRSLLNELSKGMPTMEAAWKKIKIDRAVLEDLVENGKKELGKTFMTQNSARVHSAREPPSSSRSTQSQAVSKTSRGSSDNPSKAPESWEHVKLDPDIEKDLAQYPNLISAIKKGTTLTNYYPEVNLAKRPMCALVHLESALEGLKDPNSGRRSDLQPHVSESHKIPLASDQPLPPLKTVKKNPPPSTTFSGIPSRSRLMAKAENLLGDAQKKLEILRRVETYDL